MSCGCNSNGANSSPPYGQPTATSSPVGARSSFAGRGVIARAPCGPVRCPSPPVSRAVNRDPYSPDWLGSLTDLAYGKMLVNFGGSIYNFTSRCSGPVMFDPSTGLVSVGDPPYLSSVPQETDYGYVALAVPEQQAICVDGQDDCPVEIRNTIKSQILDTTDCGDIVLVNRPACGQVNQVQASDVANQVRFDRATLKNLDDIDSSCNASGDVTLFAFYPKTISTPGGSSVCYQPVKMRRLRFTKTQWGNLLAGSADAANAPIMIAKKVGGSTDNPCLELETSDITLKQLNDTIVAQAAFPKFVNMGLTSILNVGGPGSYTVTLPSFPSASGANVKVEISVLELRVVGASGSVAVSVGAYPLGHLGAADSGQALQIGGYDTHFNTTTAVVTFTVTTSGSPAAVVVFLAVNGYQYPY